MMRTILKWTVITIGCFFGVTVIAAIFVEPPKNSPAHELSAVPAQPQASASLAAALATAQEVQYNPATPSRTPFVPTSQPQLSPAQSSGDTYYSVTKVVDGDTITVHLNGTAETIRLIGINTPETVDSRKSVECFGTHAAAAAKSLLTGKKVRIEKDPTQGERDKYDRLLAYVWREDGLFFNEYMVQEGYAYEYTYDKPYAYQTRFKAQQASAQMQQKGLWAPGICDASPSGVSQPPPSLQPSRHVFYTSTYHTAKLYYCDTDEAWKSLSPAYVKSYPSEQDVLADYPTKTLHEACK
jgi:micrococcal nuclease